MATSQVVPRWSPIRPSGNVELRNDSMDNSFPFADSDSFSDPLHRHHQQRQLNYLPQVEAEDIVNDSNSIDSKYPLLDGKGVSLTWEDLWVMAPDGNGGRRPILQGLVGYAQPGEVLAIMGPSGCGKSTLLDTLAGRLASETRQTYAYVTQDDILMTTLTVREAVCYSAQLQLPNTMTVAEKKVRAEETITEMGLIDAADTRIGGWAVKGLSGGQKRRVSICLEILTRPQLLFLDEPTSGLDSAASYHVMNRIVRLARQEGMTVLASIHQPSSDCWGRIRSSTTRLEPRSKKKARTIAQDKDL